jgi:hypothetical protein
MLTVNCNSDSDIQFTGAPRQSRGTSIPSYALGAESASVRKRQASKGYPPTAKSAEAAMLRYVKYSATFCAFIHG